jgi:signal peptidase II
VGNLADRIRLGYVVDVVDMGVGDLRFYTYNVADAAISAALVLLILMAFWPSQRRPWLAG